MIGGPLSGSALAGRVALVTGAQQGIGAAIVAALAAAGADVAVNDREASGALTDVAGAARAAGRRVLEVPGDVADASECRRLVAETVAALGRLDILVNNAGIFPRSEPLDLAEAEWDQVLGVNLKGAFFCAQAAARHMVERGGGGSIISMSSVAARGTVRGAHYAASKGGIASMTRALALDLAPHAIRVNAIAPGIVDTAQPRFGMTEAQLHAAGLASPAGRVGRPEEIANVAAFLASDGASFMTGATVHVNGGAFMV